MTTMAKTFFKGLAVIVPVAITAYVLYWLATSAEAALGPLIRRVLPDGAYMPGMGLVAGVVVILGVGVLMNVWVTQRLVQLGEQTLQKIPLVKTLYGSVKDLMSFFGGDKKDGLNQVVLVKFGDPPAHLLGFVTRDELGRLAQHLPDDDMIAIYLPMSYQIGGYTVMVPRSSIIPVDMTVEQGMRFAVTAGVSRDGTSEA